MKDLDFQFEWIEPGHARGAELRATWARLSIRVSDRFITRVEDHAVGSVRNAIYLPLYPLAEWAASNWWALLNEVASEARMASGYPGRHSLAAASEGFAAPPLLIEPTGDNFMLSWAPVELRQYGIGFISQGSVLIERQQVQDALTQFIDAVVRRLEDMGITNSFLQEEWKSIKTSDSGETEFSTMAGRLGCDPYAMEQADQQAVINAASSISESVAAEFFAAVDLVSLERQTHALRKAIASAQTIEIQLPPLIELKKRGLHLPDDQQPWQQGYSAARETRHALAMDGQIVESVEKIGELLGIARTEWKKACQNMINEIPSVDAVMAVTQNGAPWFGARRRHEPARAFAICRALFEYLTLRTGDSAVVVNTHSDRQKRNRAFAAEFLAPAEKLRQLITDPIVSDEDIQELADSLGIAPHVVRHQIENHGIARIDKW